MTNTGMIFTSLVSFLVSCSAFAAGFSMIGSIQGKNNLFRAFSLFLFVTSGLWFFVGLGLFVGWLGKDNYSLLFFLINQLFVFSSGPVLAYYLSLKIFGKPGITKIISFFYLCVAILGLFFLFKLGVESGASTYFADKFKPNKIAFLIFITMLIPLFISSFLDVLSRIVKRLFIDKKSDVYEIFYSLVVAIYLFLGVFDERGLIVGWELVFFRLIFAAVFLMAYLTFYFQQSKKEQFIETVNDDELSN